MASNGLGQFVNVRYWPKADILAACCVHVASTPFSAAWTCLGNDLRQQQRQIRRNLAHEGEEDSARPFS